MRRQPPRPSRRTHHRTSSLPTARAGRVGATPLRQQARCDMTGGRDTQIRCQLDAEILTWQARRSTCLPSGRARLCRNLTMPNATSTPCPTHGPRPLVSSCLAAGHRRLLRGVPESIRSGMSVRMASPPGLGRPHRPLSAVGTSLAPALAPSNPRSPQSRVERGQADRLMCAPISRESAEAFTATLA